jgi:methylated-DNA-[protein]-cysteine S-methyltransferase
VTQTRLNWSDIHWSTFDLEAGWTLVLAATPKGLCRLSMNTPLPDEARLAGQDSPILADAARQLRAYFDGQLREFTIPLDLEGTPFELRVWDELRRIPYGQTRSYRQLATILGNPKATRAVGAANGKNPVGIIVPCHRVIGSDGSLTGFAAGLEFKRRLLALEGYQVQQTLGFVQLQTDLQPRQT